MREVNVQITKAYGANLDYAETLNFVGNVDVIPSFDGRSDNELSETANSHSDRIERERALWEYGYRCRESSLNLLQHVLAHEADPSIRWNLLWLALKVVPGAAIGLLDFALKDDHREVRDWAKLHLKHLTGAKFSSEYDTMTYISAGSFDQTLPLQIAGFAVLTIPGLGPTRVTLSPLWFEHIMGRVLACTSLDTFMKDLTIEKLLEGYHQDGSHHYEIFPFSGVSWPTADGRIQHRYESTSIRKFYLSGRVEDKTKGVVEIPVILNRAAGSSGEALQTLPPLDALFTGRGKDTVVKTGGDVSSGVTDARGIRLLNGKVVRTVGGQFFGWAHTSLDHYVTHGKVLPGTVQLANPLNELTAELVNTYLCGTFCGKLGDYNGDGYLDLNLIRCHGTRDGKLDYNCDESIQLDPFA